jgi:Tfp pilus assembly protein PilW
MSRIDRIRDERGTTLIEVMVGTASGLVVLAALSLAMIATLHGSARVSARVNATQNARIVVARVMEELHSACFSPKIAPVQATSTGTTLKFVRANPAEGSAAAPKPIQTEIVLSGGTLTQYDKAATSSAQPWTYSSTATERRLMTGVSPVSPSSSIFSYHSYSGGAVSETPLSTPLSVADATVTVQVRVALTAAPMHTQVADKGRSASIRGSATLRLTPPSFNESAPAPPCQ